MNKVYKEKRWNNRGFKLKHFAFIIVLVILYAIFRFSNPVDADHASSFWIAFRYFEFLFLFVLQLFLAVLFAVGAGFMLVSITRGAKYQNRNGFPFFNSKSPKVFGFKSVAVGIISTVFVAALAVFLFIFLVVPDIQDVPRAITGNAVIVNGVVTGSYWTSGRSANWHFIFNNHNFTTSRPTLHRGEEAIVTYLPHNLFVIEYQHEKPE